MVVGHVTLVVDFNQNVAVAMVEDPFRGVVHGANHSPFVLQSLVLSKVKVAENHRHSQLVGLVDDPLQPAQVVRAQGTVRFNGRVVPRLVLRVSLRGTALKIDREGEQAVPPPYRHGGDKFPGVALRVPLARVGIFPLARGQRIAVVEEALHHSRVEEQSLNLAPAPGAAGVSRFAVDVKFVTDDGDGAAAIGLCSGRRKSGADSEQQRHCRPED